MKVLKSLQPLFVLLISPITSTTFKIFPSNSNSYDDDYPHHVSKQFQQSSTSFVTNPLHLIKRSTRSSSRKLSPKILRSPRLTNWGSWADYVSVCPDGEFVVGMQLKTDAFHGNHHNGAVADNTALNGIKFFCSSQPIILNESTMPPTFTSRNGTIIHTYELISIQNEVQKWGRWGSPFYCLRGGYALGFQMRSHKPLDSGAGFGFKFDDVGACNLRLFCSTGEILHGDGRNEWGVWTNIQSCPTGQALCSLRTQIERDQLFCKFSTSTINLVCTLNASCLVSLLQLDRFEMNIAHAYIYTTIPCMYTKSVILEKSKLLCKEAKQKIIFPEVILHLKLQSLSFTTTLLLCAKYEHTSCLLSQN